jgi:hypothetical protein
MYPSEGETNGERPWTPRESDVWNGDEINISCVDNRVSLVATKTTHSSPLSSEHFTSGWEIVFQERRNELDVTRRFGFVDTRENAVRFLNECRTAINRAIQNGGSINSVVVSSIVGEMISDCDVPIVRPPESAVNDNHNTILE